MIKNRNKQLTLAVVAFITVISLCMATPKNIKPNDEQLQSEINSVDLQLDYLKLKLGDSQKKTRNLENKIKKKRNEIKKIKAQIKELNSGQQVIASQANILKMESDMLKTEHKLLIKRFRGRLVQLHKIKQGTMVSNIFSAKDLNSFLNRYQMVTYLLNSDKSLIEQMKQQSLHQKKLVRSLRMRKQQLEVTKSEIAKKNSKLEREKKAINAMLSTVLLEKKVFLAKENELAKAKDLLEKEISNIDSQQNDSTVSKELSKKSESAPKSILSKQGTLPEDAPEAAKTMAFCWPIKLEDRISVSDSSHNPTVLSIRVNTKTEVRSVARGKITYRGAISGLGDVIIISHHKAFSTVYAQLDEIWVGLAQIVEQGETIGRILGGRNNALHFEIRFAGKRQQPLDYLPH